MFKLDLSPQFSVQVRFETTAADGRRQVHGFTATVPRMSAEEIEALAGEIRAQGLSDRQVAARLLLGWGDDLCNAQGDPLPFTASNVATVLNTAGVATALIAAYHAAQPRAALGN